MITGLKKAIGEYRGGEEAGSVDGWRGSVELMAKPTSQECFCFFALVDKDESPDY